jgi:hypothetical protein
MKAEFNMIPKRLVILGALLIAGVVLPIGYDLLMPNDLTYPAQPSQLSHHQHGDSKSAAFHLEIDFQNGKTMLTAHILKMAVNQTQVQFELWRRDDPMHQFIDAMGFGNGPYKAKINLQPGDWICIAHVTQDHSHEHQQVEFIVPE